MPQWIDRLAAASGTGVVTDVGGVKRAPCQAARNAALSSFVGGHPMAGAAVAGPALASPTLFTGRPWFVVAGDAPAAAVARVGDLVTACGATPVAISAEEHDRVVAAISHLPQVVASLLMLVAADHAGADGLDWAGGGLRDTTRLASSSAGVWRSIVAANRDELAPLLTELARRLTDAAGALDDGERISALFAAAARARQRLTPPL
jgi:prephenate dehydrogenase